jgi:hypothetical protein
MITADLIWFSDKLTLEIKKMLSEEFKVSKANISLCASHTHGTPNPENNFQYKKANKKLYSYILKLVEALILQIKNKKFEKTTVEYIRKKAPSISINRRKKAIVFRPKVSYLTQSLPNNNGKTDNFIDIINFSNPKKKKILCSIIKYTCHPVTDPQGMTGADYVGHLREILNKDYSDNIFFCQGYCGDIRPKLLNNNKDIKSIFINLIIGKRFRKSNITDSKNFAAKLANSISSKKNIVISRKIKNVKSTKIKKIKLELNDKKLDTIALTLQFWKFDNIAFIFANAEMLSGYILDYYKGVPIMNVGYSNGMIGYIPTASDIKNGGYEVNKSRKIFNILEKFNTNVEMKIKKTIFACLDKK